MKRSRRHSGPTLDRRSFLGGALAATLAAAAATTAGCRGRAAPPSPVPESRPEREKPRLPVWIGHI